MSREEKIHYIRSSRYYRSDFGDLEALSERRLDQLIRRIERCLRREEATASCNMLTDFYVFLN